VGTVIAKNGELELSVSDIGDERGEITNTLTGEVWLDVYVVSVLAKIGWEPIKAVVDAPAPTRQARSTDA
jgi:hypothetical protein